MNTLAKPSELILRFSGAKLLLLFAPLALLIVVSVLVNPEEWRSQSSWVYISLGGVALFLVVGCLVLPRRYFLHLTPKGLAIQYIASRRSYSWDEIRNFRVARGPKVNEMPTGRRVVFDLAEGSAQRTALVKMSAAVNGYDVSILATFGSSAAELAGVLNDWQQRYASVR
jgi:hypothetical protein